MQMYEIIGEKVTLKFALKMDMRKIYDMMVSDEIAPFMFNENFPAPSWQIFKNNEAGFFPEMASRSGSYLLIYYEGRLAGTIKYVCGYEKRPYAEFSMWLAGYEFMGRDIGCEAICLLRDYIKSSYGIVEFFIRAWTQNLSYIDMSNRCGFYESASFKIDHYYSDDDLLSFGSGFYGNNETINLYCRVVEDKVQY